MSYSHPRPARPIVLYDGQCAFCVRGVASIRARDPHHRIAFVDIARPDFNAEAWGFCQSQLNATLHVRDGQGGWLTGVDALAHLHSAVGLGWLWWPTRWQVIKRLADRVYPWLAAHRYRLLGRAGGGVCGNGRCCLHAEARE